MRRVVEKGAIRRTQKLRLLEFLRARARIFQRKIGRVDFSSKHLSMAAFDVSSWSPCKDDKNERWSEFA